MNRQKYLAFILFTLSLPIALLAGCGFEDPYVPDSAGSSTLTGRVIAEPEMDLTGTEIILHGQDSFAAIADSDGIFLFRNLPPDDYSLQMQKKPYLQGSMFVTIGKSEDKNIGDIKVNLKGAIAGTIPNDKVSIIHGEVELVIYIDGIPLVVQTGSGGGFTIDLSSDESVISIHAETKIPVFIDGVEYSAIVKEEGNFVVEFVPPSIYTDIRVKLNSKEDALPIGSGGPIVVKSGQTRLLSPVSER